MPMFIDSSTSLAAQAALDRTRRGLGVAVQRLSSGLRVNGARDDAAGLAIAARMTSHVRGTAQAVRNANDGISMAQVGDHALGSMVDLLQHMRELALQSLGGALSDADRGALQRDLQASRAELDRTASSTAFNGHHLLDGSFGVAQFQVGADSGDLLAQDLSTSLRSADVGALAVASSGDLRTLSGAGGGGFAFAGTYTTVPLSTLDFSRPTVRLVPGSADVASPPTSYAGGQSAAFTVDGHAVALNANYGSVAGVAQAVQQQLDATQPGGYVVTTSGSQLSIAHAAATTAVAIANAAGAGAGAWAAATGVAGTPASTSTHAGFDVDGHTVALTGNYAGNPGGLVADIQAQLDQGASGVYAVTGDASGISIRRTNGSALPDVDRFTGIGAAVFARNASAHLTLAAGDLSLQVGSGGAVDVTGDFYSPDALAAAIEARVPGVISVHVDQASGKMTIDARQTITVGGAQGGAGGSLGFAPSVNPASGSLDDADIGTQGTAGAAVERIDVAIDALTSRRSFFGSMQGRFDRIAESQQSEGALAQQARGRIVDADYASEASSLSRSGILQQAGLAMLAAANASAGQVLALLR
jgi:flagellin